MHIDLDTLIFALVALILIARLWSVLGTRREDEPQRPNPFTPVPTDAVVIPSVTRQLFTSAPPANSVAGGLIQIQSLDPAFDEKQFIQTARALFTQTVEAYAGADTQRLASLVSPALLDDFEKAAAARRQAGHSASSHVIDITDSDIIAATSEGAQARITVKFTSRQENMLRDTSGTIIAGKEGVSDEVVDVWVFGRDISVPDARWIVIETRA